MTADNIRVFRVTTEQPQPATVPFRDWLRIRDERDQLRAQVEALQGAPLLRATPEESERGDDILARAIDLLHHEDRETERANVWRRAFHCVPVAVLYAYSLGYHDATLDGARPEHDHDAYAHGWWTPDRVALVAAVLAIIAIVIMGR